MKLLNLFEQICLFLSKMCKESVRSRYWLIDHEKFTHYFTTLNVYQSTSQTFANFLVQEVQAEGRYAIDSPGNPNNPEIPPEDYALRELTLIMKISTDESQSILWTKIRTFVSRW